MKKYLHLNYHIIKRIAFVFLAILLILNESFAGDITFSLKFKIEVATEDQEQPIVTEINNQENFQVLDASLDYTITDKLSLKVAYNWSKDIGTVEPNSSITLKAPNPWIPKEGTYIVDYKLSSSNDINPSNDEVSYEVEVKPNPGLLFKFNQWDFKNPFQQELSSTGRVDFKIPPNTMNRFVNLMFKMPGSSLPSEWLVHNFPAPAFPDTQEISYWIDLGKIGITDGMEVPYLRYDYSISDTPIMSPFASTGMYLSKVFRDDYNVGGDNSVEWIPETYLKTPIIDWGGDFKIKTWNYRGCNVPNIDLDSSTYNPRDMEGEVGDWNACGPASAVNSLQWLETNNDKIPDLGTSIREKLKIFNEVSKRDNENGLNTAGVIKGKLAFIDSLKLPIHVKWQGVPTTKDSIASPNEKYNHIAKGKNDSVGAYATFDWLVSEIEKGEDVEIKFGWYDTLNVRDGGHWVVVSGVSDVNIAQGVYVKDDNDQKKSGGTRQTYVNWVTNEQGRPRLVGFKGKNNRCWVESVVSESYDSTITFVPTYTEKIANNNQFNLSVYENPGSRSIPVTIEYDTKEAGAVKVYIYEMTGRLVFSKGTNYGSPGRKKIMWDGKENNGLQTSNGIYLVKVISGKLSSTKKLVMQD